MQYNRFFVLGLMGGLAALATSSSLAEPGRPAKSKVDFNREIRPILSKNCFACHGSDEKHRSAGLRLDVRDSALKKRKNGRIAIVPGKIDESELIRRITEKDVDERMPPEESGNHLTADQIETLKRWVAEGAPYAEHWAFVKPQRHSLPSFGRDPGAPGIAWLRNGVDHFVLARLRDEGLMPSAEADRFILLRRTSLDIRGLPPSLEEIDAFAKDVSPNAYEKMVDKFLADPAYGERWARVWMDLARYADSAGLGSDPLRPNMWRYRDWVIEAINKNMPYDRFTIEQIAGDLLPNATEAQKIATAFHRNTMTNTEGGTDDEEFRVAAVKDRIATTMQVWMGLTFGCAQCHSHKYDPISHKDYYRFFAFFNQTADNDQPDESPTMLAPTAEQAEQDRRIVAQLEELKKKLNGPNTELAAAQPAWEADLRSATPWVVLDPTEMLSEGKATLKKQPDGSIKVEGSNPVNDTYSITAKVNLPAITGLRLEAIPDATLPKGGSGRADDGNFVLSRIKLTAIPADPVTSPTSKPLDVPFAKAVADFSQGKFNVENALKGDPAAMGWGVAPKQKEPHTALFFASQPVSLPSPSLLTIRLEHRYKLAHFTLGRFRLAVTADAKAPARAFIPADVLAAIDTPKEKRSPTQVEAIDRYYRSIAPTLKPLRDEIAKLEKSRPPISRLPVMVELPADKRRTTRMMNKGNFLDPGEVVEAGLPSSFPPMPKDSPANRWGVAQWLVHPDNPLTARVAVNRLWAQLFGVGLVETEEDFGTQGELPSHPELLDWLAIEYRDTLKWDTKALLKLLVTSATYRQSSKVTPELLLRDPRNRLLTRGPRYRLEAEMVRDQALALSGLLQRQLGGPSVYPPQPEGLWQAAFNGQRTWTTSSGPDRYRRGLYTFWRRTVPYPSMAAFDAPSREICSVKRVRSNTPVQAFVTLNDPVYIEAAQALARRIVREGGNSVEERARFGLRLCLARPPETEQVQKIVSLFGDDREHYRHKPAEAAKLCTDPLGPLPAGMNAEELAAWTVVANVLLNLDGVLTKG